MAHDSKIKDKGHRGLTCFVDEITQRTNGFTWFIDDDMWITHPWFHEPIKASSLWIVTSFIDDFIRLVNDSIKSIFDFTCSVKIPNKWPVNDFMKMHACKYCINDPTQLINDPMELMNAITYFINGSMVSYGETQISYGWLIISHGCPIIAHGLWIPLMHDSLLLE